MYSPKISPELIPRIYREAKRLGVHMTTWVNTVVELALNKLDDFEEKERRKTTHDDGTSREESRKSGERGDDNFA